MKSRTIALLLITIGLTWVEGFCQVPQAINYQAVARNISGNAIGTKAIKIRVSIIQGSTSGQVVYQETQDVTTDNAGVFSIKIGLGTPVTGAFSKIDWPSGDKFVKSEFDFNDGSGFQLSGVSQMLSVPFALYAGNGTQWNSLVSDPNLLGIKYSDGKTASYEFSNGDPTPGGVSVGLTIKNNKTTANSWSFLDLISGSSLASGNRSYLSLKNPTGSYTIERVDSTLLFNKWKGNGGTPIFQYRPDFGHKFAGNIGADGLKIGTPQTQSVTGAKISAFGGGLFTDRFLEIDDADANSHINTYENNISNPIIYKRYFYGQYGDLIIQGNSKTYTGNIHFVTGSTVPGASPPTQRMVIRGNGDIGISGNLGIGLGPNDQFTSKINVRGDVKTDFLKFDDSDANSHINTYENNFNTPLLYSRYFYGQYSDLIIQGNSKTYTGNIHFVTGSSVAGADVPTQRMVIMGNGNIGIGNFVPNNAPKSKLQIQNGDVYLENIGSGVIIKSPNGQCWRITIDNTGNLLRTAITCP